MPLPELPLHRTGCGAFRSVCRALSGNGWGCSEGAVPSHELAMCQDVLRDEHGGTASHTQQPSCSAASGAPGTGRCEAHLGKRLCPLSREGALQVFRPSSALTFVFRRNSTLKGSCRKAPSQPQSTSSTKESAKIMTVHVLCSLWPPGLLCAGWALWMRSGVCHHQPRCK